MMRRTAGVLGVAFAVIQLVAQPVMAMDAVPPVIQIQGKKTELRAPHGDPAGPSASDSLSAGPIGDLKVELDSGWWVGEERHSKFKVSNIGTGPSYGVMLFTRILVVKDASDSDYYLNDTQALGDMPAGAFLFVTRVCTPTPGWHCDETGLRGWTPGSDLNAANDKAVDKP